MEQMTHHYPESQAEESAGPTRGWTAWLIIATIGVYAGWFGPLQLLLPSQALEITKGIGSENLLAMVTGIGAAISMIANPAWGLASDRFRLRYGSRVPVLIAGLTVAVVGLVVLSQAMSVIPMVIGWGLVQVGLNGPFAVLLAFIADRVPEAHRGTVGSLFGAAQLLGAVTGNAVALIFNSERIGYIALAIAVPCLVLPIAVLHKRGRDLASASHSVAFSWSDVKLDSTFVAAFCMRFFLNLVNALMLLYLLYFVMERLGQSKDDADGTVFVLTLVYVGLAAVAAAGGGIVSDKMHRRKIWVVYAAVVGAVGGVVLAFAHDFGVLIVGTVAFAIGYGLFLAVDVGIITAALPNEKTRATMLGVANLASASPQALAPAIAAPIVANAGGYTGLYIVTAAVGLMAIVFLPMLKKID
ncbi:MAG: MFS transporter [Actinomycetaceae bacterium]|nr:MFS transporter [Arcanobacterium sp.]MDD7687087.1 MFS transporter [Actinomycetaceae bacterium]MDY5273247.1 MFS transporter [Arcanobacterium sp.]